MTKDEFHSLSTGDIVRSKFTKNSVLVVSNYGNRVTAIQTYDLTNPEEWELCLKAEYSTKRKTSFRIRTERKIKLLSILAEKAASGYYNGGLPNIIIKTKLRQSIKTLEWVLGYAVDTIPTKDLDFWRTVWSKHSVRISKLKNKSRLFKFL